MVALDCALGAADFLREAGALLCERCMVRALVGGGVLDRLADEGAVAVELGAVAVGCGAGLALENGMALLPSIAF